ncbi:MAG: YpdA family putative bacillithiol disulfide reductase [Hydrotalea flava]|uniref:YpdA family putative bacillithiol disulfide reductase n=1 Tax=Hydrotalea TaxID=1004300 RepID=UPI001C48B331|nr:MULTISPECIES: YpdA family putative bacillithiol disulfide reductase [Hydrotalea]MBY0347009.1 YpdA family putative bacillithiol disulfide reductase [Hydrotalea flava]
MNESEILDVIIIGGGPIGLACALEAKTHQLNYVILEKGCLVNSLYHYPMNMTFFSTSEKLEIGGVPFVSIASKPTRNEALEYYRRVAIKEQLNIHLFEKVLCVKPLQERNKPVFEVKTSKATYHSYNIVTATGFYDIPFLLNVPGEDLPKVTHYYKDPHFYAFQQVIVVGANNSAVDAALETWRKGANVTMVIRESQIGERVKYWVRPDIINRIEEGSIRAYFNSVITAIEPHQVHIQTPDGAVIIPNQWVIAATGYQPDFSFLQQMGIQLSDDGVKKPSYDENTHETNVPGIYLAGVVCGGLNTHRLFIENSREHAIKILNHIAAKNT